MAGKMIVAEKVNDADVYDDRVSLFVRVVDGPAATIGKEVCVRLTEAEVRALARQLGLLPG